jgi:hypothetical protein
MTRPPVVEDPPESRLAEKIDPLLSMLRYLQLLFYVAP